MMKNRIPTLFSIFALVITSFNSYGQTQVCLGTDASICLGDQITINDCANMGAGSTGDPYTLSPIAYNPDPFSTPNTVNLSDDQFSQVINIGFDFCFYGNTYTQLVISSNNYISFNTANANSYSTWATTAIPNIGLANTQNAIMAPWQDINPANGGVISYAMYGTAPNRRFVVTWSNVPMFGCTGITYSSQIKIFESSNNIETHIVNKQVCASWNSGNAVHGVHSPGGTDALTVPGRNNTQWSVANEGYLWVPQLSVQWEDTQGNIFPYVSNSLTVTPIPIPPSDSVGYFLSIVDNCGTGLGSSDTSWITVIQANVSASGIDDICSASQGEVTANPLSGIGPYTYDWTNIGNASTQTVTNLVAGTYNVTMTDNIGCTSTASVTIGDTPAAFSGTTTVVSCPGGNDGTATAIMTPILGNITYQWDDPAGQTTATAVGLTAGQYNCTVTSDIGCSDVVTVNITEIPGMIGVITSQSDVTCNSSNDGIIDIDITQGTGPYTYSWDNSTSTTDIANDLFAGTHTVTITDDNGCVIAITTTIGEPASLAIVSLTPDTQICPEDDIMLTAVGSGGSSPYTFTWTEAGNVVGTGTTITVDPTVTNTQYCVTLSEVCGSPTDNECTMIYFPTPIEPSATVDEAEKCMPGYFEFTNTSLNGVEIASTYWEFGPDGSTLEIGNDSTHYQFNEVGIFDVILTTTSIYGCVYTDTMKQIVEVKPNPIADFTFSANPTTVYEPAVQMQDRSSVDVVAYSWYSPYSNPSASGISDPKFHFPEEVGNYPVTLAVETEHGCVDTLTLYLHVVQDILFFAPNSFTPDGDEHNQVWKAEIQGIDEYDFELLIFNRWGELIWESHDPSIGWDGTYKGKIVQAGMYTWVARVKDLYNDDKHVFNGSINIMK